MQIIKICISMVLLVSVVTAKPTFDVIADIMHDLVHDPYHPSNHRPPPPLYAQSGVSISSGYNRPAYTQGGYAYDQRPYQSAGYYPNNPQSGYYPSTGPGGYGHNSLYDNQGYYKGPPYPNQANGYNYNNGYTSPPRHGYKNRGY